MPVTPRDRPLDALRDEAIDHLIMNYGHGQLSLAAFERRLDEALEATDHDTLVGLTADLDLEIDAGYIEKKKSELGLGARHEEARDIEYMVDIFSGGERAGRWIAPRELRVFTIFGGTDIDFSDARFSQATTRVRLVCIFGGVDIYVPEGVNTVVRTFCVFGGVSDRSPASENPDADTLIVEGLVLFGGADIKVRKTLRERLRDFADSLRSVFSPTPPPGRP